MQFHVRVAGGTSNSLALDHALLYVIGVNLPIHKLDQMDQVLVLASPVNDVNLHAWNTTRIIRFIIIDAGIQMELCPTCMGLHHKKVITFLVRPDFVQDCMDFLLQEIHASDVQPYQYMFNGPFVYDIPHKCCVLHDRSLTMSSCTSSVPHCIDPELAVLMPEHNTKGVKATVSSHVRINSPIFRTSASTISTHTTSSTMVPLMMVPPPLPPRDQFRGQHQTNDPQPYIDCKPLNTGPYEGDQLFDVPYQISHRIYINDMGMFKKESQVVGSGNGEFRKNVKPRIVTETNVPHQRPQFIGRRPPMLPPRGITLDYIKKKENPVDDSLQDGSPITVDILQNPHIIIEPAHEDNKWRHIAKENSSPETEHKYTNIQRWESNLSLCTDDITNADFELMTKVSFKNIIPSQYSLPRTASESVSKRPMPLPRSKTLNKTEKLTNASVDKQTISTEVVTGNPLLQQHKQTSPSSLSDSHLLPQPVAKEQLKKLMYRSQSSGSISSSSSSDRSDDYKRVQQLSSEC